MIIMIIGILCALPLSAQMDTLTEQGKSIPEWGDIQIMGEVSADSIPQNDTLTFTVRLIMTGNPDDYAISDPGNPPVANLKLLGTAQANRTESGDDGVKLIKEYKYTFLPSSIGMAYINPFRVQYIYVPNGVSRNISTGRMEIKVTDPVFPKEPMKAWPFIIIGIVLVCVAVFFLYWRSRSKANLRDAEEISRTPEEAARDSIREAKKIGNDNPENLISALARIFTIYVTDRYGIDARSLSDDQLVEALEMKGVPAPVLKNVAQSLDRADKVRFAAMNANAGDADMVELGIESLIAHGEKIIRIENENRKEDK